MTDYIPKFKEGDWVRYEGETWKVTMTGTDNGPAYALQKYGGSYTYVVICEKADKSMYFA